MRLTVFGVLAFCPHTAMAEVNEASRIEIVEIARDFSDHIKAGDGIEFSITTMHMQFARNAARTFGLETTEEIFASMRLGYEMSTQIYTVVQHDVLPDQATFGVAGNWTWGIVPYQAQLKDRTTAAMLPESCNGLLVFGQDGIWFTHSMSETADAILVATLPEFSTTDLEQPACEAGTS